MNPDELIMGPEAGQILGKSGRTIARMAATGQLPYAMKLPGPKGAYLFRRSAIEALAAAASEEPEPNGAQVA